MNGCMDRGGIVLLAMPYCLIYIYLDEFDTQVENTILSLNNYSMIEPFPSHS